MIVNKLVRVPAIVAAAALFLAVIIPALRADALSSSSLTLSDSRPSQSPVSYTFGSSSFSGATLNCITLEFNTDADGSGTVPTGLTSTGASLNASSTLITEASWTKTFTTNGTLELTSGAEAPASSGNLVFDGITNGSVADTTYFALFNTYTNSDCSTGLTDSVVVTLIYKNGSLVSLTIDPTLTFAIAGVSDTAETVNGVSTTVTSTAAAINFLNEVVSGAPGVSAHDITVGTNASSGYTVYIRHTGLLTNGSSDTIDNWTGTNLSPTGSFPTAAEAWGYTTQDSTLSAIGDGANRFGSDEWAGFSTTNEEVIYSATPQASETTRVGHQVAVDASTEAGTYQTTIVYTAASVY